MRELGAFKRSVVHKVRHSVVGILWRSVIVGLAGAGTAVVGGVVADRMPDQLSNLLFAAMLLYMAVRLLREARSTR